MSTFQSEEKKRTTTYDVKILKWLLGYIKTNKLFFILALLFMILTAGFEVLIPYLTKTAVDKYIYPSWVMTEKPYKNVGTLLSEYPGHIISLNNNRYLIDISEIDDVDRTNLEKSGALGETKYIVFNTGNLSGKRKEDLTRIFKENSGIFKGVLAKPGEGSDSQPSRIHYAKFADLESLSKSQIAILRSESLQSLKILVLYIFISLVCVFIFTTSFTYLLYYSGHKIMHRIRTDAFSHILKLPQPFFDRNPVGRLTTRVTNDVNAINEMYTSVLVQFIKDLLVIVGIVVIMMNMDRNLTLIILGLTFFLGLVAGFFRMRLKKVFRNIRITIGKLNSFVQESIQGIMLIKLYGRESHNFNRFRDINRENYSANMSQLWTYVMFRPFIEYVTILGIAIILWYGGLNVIQYELTIGALIAFLYYVRMLFKPIQELSERYNIFQSAAAASENLYDLVHEEIEASGKEKVSAAAGTAIIEFKNVWFSYNDKDWVLKDVSFKIKPGETIALVGLTGSGKSTIVNLILKYYKVDRGEILFNGINIDKLENDSLRSNITAVFQDLFLFGKDISDDTMDSKKVESSFGLDNEIDTSARLSSGENQIVSLAKAFEKESSLLIMDEATSHIDAEIERKIQRSVRDYRKKTKLIIAHRLSNVRGADRILVIHKGEIVESGTHYELLEKKGIYHTLHNFQQEIQKVSSTTIQ